MNKQQQSNQQTSHINPVLNPQQSRQGKSMKKILVISITTVLAIIAIAIYFVYPQIILKLAQNKYGNSILIIDGHFGNTYVTWEFRETGAIYYPGDYNSIVAPKLRLKISTAPLSDNEISDLKQASGLLPNLAEGSSILSYSENCQNQSNSSQESVFPTANAQVNVNIEGWVSCFAAIWANNFKVITDNCIYTNKCANPVSESDKEPDLFIKSMNMILNKIGLPTVSAVFERYYVDANVNAY